jgi:transcriptional regulator with XRE-family HTH domain
MDGQARAIGQRVRYWRLRRNLGRQRFADMVGRSMSWLGKVEKGERSLLRLPILERVAAVLDICERYRFWPHQSRRPRRTMPC